MKQRLGALGADVSLPERNKFTSPLLLLPGLWSGSWMWSEVATALSVRGWECWALDVRGRPDSQTVSAVGKIRLEDYVADAVAAIQALWAPPIVWGADLGALLALLAAGYSTPRALVCSTPVLPWSWTPEERPPLPLLGLSTLPALLLGRPLSPPPPRIARQFLFPGLSETLQSALQTRLIPDSGSLVRTLTRESVSAPTRAPTCPGLVLQAGNDKLSSKAACRWLARHLRAQEHVYPDHGHWLYNGPIGAKLAADVHRWLIQTLGQPLLIPPEDEDV